MRKGWTKFNNGKAFEISEKYGGLYFAVYLTIYSHVNAKDGYAYPSQRMIMKEAGVAKNTLLKIVKTLKEDGYIVVDKGENGESNKYLFPYEDLCNEKILEELLNTMQKRPKATQPQALTTFSDEENEF